MIRSLNRTLTSHTRVAGMSLKPKPAPLPFSTLPRERFEALAAWAVSQGARISDGVAFRESGDLGPGLVAARDLAPDENLIVLPQRCMISLDDGATSEAILAVCEEIPDALWGLRLGLRLLAERARGEASPHAPYVASLPAAISVPMFFAPNEVTALQYPPLIHQVGLRGRFLHGLCQRHLAPNGGAHLFHGRRADLGAVGYRGIGSISGQLG